MIPPELQINYTAPVAEDMKFQQRSWQVERAGWCIMAVIMLAALLGLFAEGPLSGTSHNSGSLAIKHERFARYSLPTDYTVSFESNTPLHLSDNFHDYYRVKITPEPARQIYNDAYTTYLFDENSGQRVKARIEVTPIKSGHFSGKIGAGADTFIEISQFIYR